MSPDLEFFIRGIAVGALLVTGLAVWNSAVSRHARIATLMAMLSLAAWVICEGPLWAVMGRPYVVLALSFPVGGFFWLFVAAVFEDRPITPLRLLAVAAPLTTGVVMNLPDGPQNTPVWIVHNVLGGALVLHAGFIIVRGWRDDLIESRRRLRGVVFGASAIYGMIEVTLSLSSRFGPGASLRAFLVSGPWGGVAMALLALGSAGLLLNARPSLFGPGRRAEARADTRSDVADRQLLGKLEAFMAEGGWKTEGLTIGAVAQALDTPEHRVRRLINQKLGHRNFADFVNGHRIEAAKRRLADPDEARLTVAAIAFDLGYGSLGPFNRAFRAATGATPTEWRRQALAASEGNASPILEEAV
jgi:AraC-like DNA-binding protein